MNVRFSKGEIRFRVSPEEFSRLRGGTDLELEAIPLNFVIHAAKRELQQGMAIDVNCSSVHLVLSQEELTELDSKLPSRDGIEKLLPLPGEKQLKVAFEVDIQKGHKAKMLTK